LVRRIRRLDAVRVDIARDVRVARVDIIESLTTFRPSPVIVDVPAHLPLHGTRVGPERLEFWCRRGAGARRLSL
jgi:hypothetical protein